jgi:hypothetical protein
LIRDVPPTEVGQRRVGYHPESVTRINAGLDDGAEVCPVVTKVEHIDELLRGLEMRKVLPPFVEHVIVVPFRVRSADSSAICELEFMLVRAIPAGEGVIDGGGKLCIGMAPSRSEQPARPRPVTFASTLDQLDPDR